MKKINVVGTSATGKSTFSRALATKLGLHYIELDNLFWLDDWQECPDEIFFARIEAEMVKAKNGYVIDGNYTRAIPVKWAEIDTVIWLDLPFPINLYRSIKRALSRAKSKQDLWPDSNNQESLWRMFGSDSIVWWMIKTHQKNRNKYIKMMSAPEFQHIQWIRLKTPKQVEHFLAQLDSYEYLV
ncbi:adenylate kinase [Acinetobacter sp. ANC 5054]|uniref:adenylate kinase n=1 Tax=Acinetobacter sp. ANC 5054 TaxID=1977877 RepID=UPI000A349B22|nr:adenylate kinase [Acinetobacter sp. ANC 5054]OTG79269.1 adenylate kinase [Acinetobacter sp. ANC 5054]